MQSGMAQGQAASPRQATIVDAIETRLNVIIARLVRTDETINMVLDQVIGPRPSPIKPPGGFATDAQVRNLTLYDIIDRLESVSCELESSLNRLNA